MGMQCHASDFWLTCHHIFLAPCDGICIPVQRTAKNNTANAICGGW